jgi:hypothetical protein
MPFEKETRYVIRRIREDGQMIYMNAVGGDTYIRPVFGATWETGEPVELTHYQAMKAVAKDVRVWYIVPKDSLKGWN